MKLLCAFVALCLFGNAFAQIPRLGRCPEVKVQQDFDIAKYMGVWYEQERYFTMFELGTKCNIVDYSLAKNGSIKVFDYYVNSLNDSPGTIVEYIHLPNVEQPTRMRASPPMLPSGTMGDYLILGTDYNNYSVVFGCVDYKFMHLRYSWILSRARVAEESVLAEAHKVVLENKLSTRSYYKVDQATCAERPSE